MAKKHRVFGSIEYGSDQWEGQVRAPFFAGYDHPSTVFEYLPEWKHKQFKEGLYDLFIQDEAGTGPTKEQQRAFVHFQENQDAICARVVAAIFPYYQNEYENRELTTQWLSQAELDELFPAIEGLEGLKGVIRFRNLSILEGMGQWDMGGTEPETWAKLDHWALLGFNFSCTWDIEHGLGVVYHKDRVVEVSISDITWNGPSEF